MQRSLVPHPLTPDSPVTAIEADAFRLEDGKVILSFLALGDNVRLPAEDGPKRADELWRHTCFEAFFRTVEAEAYYEFNLSPSRAWAAYRFDGYRSGMSNADVDPPAIVPKRLGAMFSLHATLDLAPLAELVPWESWRVGLSAVVEAEDGGISYWALAHAPGKPDFHRPDCFAAELAPAATL